MFFKIENKESQLYKDVMDFINKRRTIKISNMNKAERLIEELTGLNCTQFDLLVSSNGFRLIPWPSGIQLKNNTPIPEGFIMSKQRGFVCPNGRSKIGKQLNKLFDSLPNLNYSLILEVLKIKNKHLRSFTIPYLEEFNAVIIARVDSQLKPKATDDFIEITETEFLRIADSEK